ncbi:MAG: peptidase M15 [Ignavibacteriae bacterium]|nr:MAG: peptidase M15 [Ignavibacteriota bacterium]
MKKIILNIIFFITSFNFAQPDSISLVLLKDIIPNVVIELKYATTDNVFNNTKLYESNKCYVLKSLAVRLKKVQDSLNNIKIFNSKSYPKGLGLKIWDGYRPLSVQKKMFAMFPDPTFVADPKRGSSHNRGGAVDLTIINLLTGKELKMPTKFDDFTKIASHNYPADSLSEEVAANRNLLKSLMLEVGGIDFYIDEWWHYQLFDNKKYPLLDFQIK